MAIDFNALAQQAAQQKDFTQTSSNDGDYERELPVAGTALCRLREYIELGLHETKSELYPNKKPQRKARFVFELVLPKHLQQFGEGEDMVKRPHCINVTLPISTSEKSNFIKMFRLLNWDQQAVHPAQLLGKGFMCSVIHAWKKGADPKKDKPMYANLRDANGFTFKPARIEDPVEGTIKEIPVPPLCDGSDSMRIFLFDNPTLETWATLHIAGTYERDGKQHSKNFLQEEIMKALDYPGSCVEEMILAGADGGLGDLPAGEPAGEPAPTGGTPDEPIDPLADMGL